MFFATEWALIPPLLAIGMALITKEVYLSLLSGIFVGALLAAGFEPVEALRIAVVDGMSASVASLAGNLLFLVLMGALAAMLAKSGSVRAFGLWAKTRIRSGISAQIATFFLGLLLFIDDYFNCLTVGTAMRSITDSHRISRAKLAYLIDATAAPVCIIAPISTWSAVVFGVADNLGTGVSGIWLFIQTIPYNFYALLTFVFIFVLICLRADYGKMRVAEEKARLHGELGEVESPGESSEAAPADDADASRAIVADLFFPLAALMGACIFFMMYVGGFFGATPWCGMENAGDPVAAFGATDTLIALPCGGTVAFLLSCLYFSLRRTVSLRDMAYCLPKGLGAMIPGILLLVFAATLKTVTSELGTAIYVQQFFLGASSGMYAVLPAFLFLVSLLIAFATGTSYGTFGVMLPIAAAAFPPDSELLIIGLSASLSGAVCGDHCSPISDTTVMSSTGAQVDHIQHVETQLPYVVPVAVVSFAMYLMAGFWQSWPLCLGIGSLLVVLFLKFVSRRARV